MAYVLLRLFAFLRVRIATVGVVQELGLVWGMPLLVQPTTECTDHDAFRANRERFNALTRLPVLCGDTEAGMQMIIAYALANSRSNGAVFGRLLMFYAASCLRLAQRDAGLLLQAETPVGQMQITTSVCVAHA